MKKLNNKGITTIEVIISFVIVVIITASLYTTVSNYNQKRLLENYKSKIYTYKNTLNIEIQDDFIKIGLTHASYKNEHKNSSIVHTVECDLRDGTKRKLIVTQRFTDSNYHAGDPNVDDYFMIQYGNEEAGDMLDYPLPNIGQSLSDNNKVVYDLSINNVLISIEDDNILSIYIGFYHPELMTRYGINIICPIDFVSKGVDTSSNFNVREATKATKKYSFRANGGSGNINPIAATIGQPFTIPGKGLIVREGYTLTGWNTQSDGTGKDFDIGETVVPASNQVNDITLYAQWQKVNATSFDFSGSVKSYTVPATGRYKLEVWGAAGGGTVDQSKSSHAGLGAYTVAEAKLTKGDVLYVVVGGAGTYDVGDGSVEHAVAGGYNGGGATYQAINGGAGSGGGATHIAKVTGLLKNIYASRDKVYVVAGGGGGSDNSENSTPGTSDDGSGGAGGGTTGQNGFLAGVLASGSDYHNSTSTAGSGCGLAGAQSKGYAFGLGETATAGGDAGGAGGGWYGGYTLSHGNGGGAGGSGYINPTLNIAGTAKMYCYGCPADGNTISVDQYSATATSQKAKSGNGYAKITFISDN